MVLSFDCSSFLFVQFRIVALPNPWSSLGGAGWGYEIGV
jgi:hypothetical protein